MCVVLIPCFRKCSLLTIDEPPFADVSHVINNVRGVGQECVQLTADEINKRFPGLSLSPEECGALEPSSGLIQADHAVKALQVSALCSLAMQIAVFYGRMKNPEIQNRIRNRNWIRNWNRNRNLTNK